jgi:6-pyruvoyltetrahydropterin/6-carboxytetrahydropterin synthase
MLQREAPLEKVLEETYNNIKVFDFQPTCENLTLYIAGILKPVIKPPHQLHSVRLYETPRSFAEWVR